MEFLQKYSAAVAIVALILVALVSFLFIQFFSRQGQEQTNSAQVSADEGVPSPTVFIERTLSINSGGNTLPADGESPVGDASSLTYTDEDTGFTFQYAEGWQVSKGSRRSEQPVYGESVEDVYLIEPETAGETTTITIIAETLGGNTAADIVDCGTEPNCQEEVINALPFVITQSGGSFTALSVKDEIIYRVESEGAEESQIAGAITRTISFSTSARNNTQETEPAVGVEEEEESSPREQDDSTAAPLPDSIDDSGEAETPNTNSDDLTQ